MNVFELEASLTLDTNEYERALEDAESKSKQLEGAVEQMGREADGAKGDMSGLAGGIKEAGSAAGQADDDMGDLAKQMENAALKGNLLSSAIEAGLGFIKDFAQEIWNLDEATEEYRVSQGKLTTAFQASGYDVKTAKSAFREMYAILGDTDQATEASQLLAKLATDTQDFSDWASIAAGVAGTFGSALPTESLIESANETAKVGEVTGTLADALNWAGISEDEFNTKLAELTTSEERTALITETLNDIYNEAAGIYRDNAGAIMAARDAQLRLTEAQSAAGEGISRLKTALSTLFAPAVEKIFEWTGGLADAFAGVVEGWNEARAELEKPVQSPTIYDMENALANMKTRMEEIAALSPEEMTTELGTEYARLADYIKYTEEALAAAKAEVMDTSGELVLLGDDSEAAAAALDKITVSAAGMEIEIEGSGLAAEEAQARLDSYTSAAQNMFSKISEESSVSYDEMVGNLEYNAEAVGRWEENMASIAGVLPEEMAQMFIDGGPAMYAGVVAMLAETNEGSDEGLQKLREAWEKGGDAAIEAFLASLGSYPEDAENPATITAEAFNNDTSMQTAAVSVVQRTSSAFTGAVQSGGWRTAGVSAINMFIGGMRTMQASAVAAAQSIAAAAASALASGLSSMMSMVSSAGSMTGNIGGGSAVQLATGLDFVPYDGFPATLHYGEAVLTETEADRWRRGESGGASGGAVLQLLERILVAVESERVTNLAAPDGKTIARYVAPYMGTQMAFSR